MRRREAMLDFLKDDPLFEEFTALAAGLASEGAATVGELRATVRDIYPGDDDAWYEAWLATADRVAEQAAASAAGGHRASARSAYMRAGLYYGNAYRPLYGTPVEPRLVEAFRRQMATLAKAATLFDPPFEPLEIAYENTTMPGYFIPAVGDGRRPLLIATNGYDATIVEMWPGIAMAARRRGYHCLIFDGPGQGRMLFEQGIAMRPDWEHVVKPVVDYALTRDDVDPDRMAITGWSLGGYLAPRAASGERRLAACIADPGLWGIFHGMKARMAALGVSPAVVDALPDVDERDLKPAFDAIEAGRATRWAVVKRGLWVQGAKSLMDFVRLSVDYTMDERAGLIRCPTLIAAAENDPLSSSAQALFDALTCPKAFVRFTEAEGAGDHCEILNRSLFHQRTFDWLDEVFRLT
jgi:alpha-beta hydrolase superfamily lysophospholipase